MSHRYWTNYVTQRCADSDYLERRILAKQADIRARALVEIASLRNEIAELDVYIAAAPNQGDRMPYVGLRGETIEELEALLRLFDEDQAGESQPQAA